MLLCNGQVVLLKRDIGKLSMILEHPSDDGITEEMIRDIMYRYWFSLEYKQKR